MVIFLFMVYFVFVFTRANYKIVFISEKIGKTHDIKIINEFNTLKVYWVDHRPKLF